MRILLVSFFTSVLLPTLGAAQSFLASPHPDLMPKDTVPKAIQVRDIDNAITPEAQNRIDVTRAPAYRHPEALNSEFSGDFSKTVLPLLYNVSGATTMGDGSHYWSPAVTPFQSLTNFASGVNVSNTDNSGRTGYATYRTMINHAGQGDAGSYYSFCQLSGAAKPSATTWLANPACVMLSGDSGASSDGGYLQGIGDLNFSDNGYDVAAMADVRNFNRTNNAAALGQVWMGYRLQAAGTKPFEVLVSGSGPGLVGLDTTQMTGVLAAVNMAADQKIVFNSTATPINGINWYGNTTGGAFIQYSSTTSAVEIGVGGSPRLSLNALGLQVNGAITIQGKISAGRSVGVSCKGAPTSSFATVNGIVTHC